MNETDQLLKHIRGEKHKVCPCVLNSPPGSRRLCSDEPPSPSVPPCAEADADAALVAEGAGDGARAYALELHLRDVGVQRRADVHRSPGAPMGGGWSGVPRARGVGGGWERRVEMRGGGKPWSEWLAKPPLRLAGASPRMKREWGDRVLQGRNVQPNLVKPPTYRHTTEGSPGEGLGTRNSPTSCRYFSAAAEGGYICECCDARHYEIRCLTDFDPTNAVPKTLSEEKKCARRTLKMISLLHRTAVLLLVNRV